MNKTGQNRSGLRNRASFILSLCSVLFIFTGCGGEQTAQALSPVHTKAIEYNQTGMRAAEKGDYEKALNYYQEALRLSQSVEDTEGTAMNLINISVTYQKMGNLSKAHEFVDMIFSGPDTGESFKSEAAFEKARLYLKEKNLSKAREWVNKALSLNKGLREGSRQNLLGRIAFLEDKYDEAMAAASAALKLNKESKQFAEEANSWRLLAEINAQKNLFYESGEGYMKALQIDKNLGDGKKIAMDLRGLGELAFKQGHHKNAIGYYIRAFNVSKNADDAEGALAAIESLAGIYKKSGDSKSAEEILKKKSDFKKMQ